MTHVCIRLTCYARAGQLVLLKSMLYCAPVYVFILASNATKKVSMAIICMRFESIASSLFPAAFANIFHRW